jgi:hypothetical protein
MYIVTFCDIIGCLGHRKVKGRENLRDKETHILHNAVDIT